MVNPQTGEEEWIELYNNNDFDAVLIRWSVDDIEDGGSTPKTFTITIPSRGYSVVELGTSLFNNDGDSFRLLDTFEIEKDKFDYLYSEKGKTWGRTSFDTKIYCLQEPTYGLPNGQCVLTANTIASSEKKISPSTTQTKPLATKTTRKEAPSSRGLENKTSPAKFKSKQTAQGEILGQQNINPKTQEPKLSQTLSTLSFFYSLLTIFSVFLKIKAGIIS